ncbi:MAG TPA: helix-turn-helix domain-containing protein [Hyphomicrobiales bacterium]|nr:helix-turn-helix domain-containing protein [Hyphomicrobiales bacterium]
MASQTASAVTPRSEAPGHLAQVVLGDSWTILILYEAFRGSRRFSDWRAALPISELVLADRLKRLTALDVMIRVLVPGTRSYEYRLTEMGLDLWRVLLAIWSWQEAWTPQRRGPTDLFRHAVCGAPARAVLICAACGETVGPHDTFLASQRVPTAVAATAPPRYRRSVVAGDDRGFTRETMDVVGNRWSNLLLGALFLGRHCFDEIESDLGLPPALLSQRLGSFVARGILERSRHRINARRQFYRLTDKGLALYPVVANVVDWGNAWLSSDPDAFVTMHRGCGHRFRPVLVCETCGEPLSRETTTIEPAN